MTGRDKLKINTAKECVEAANIFKGLVILRTVVVQIITRRARNNTEERMMIQVNRCNLSKI